MLLESVDPGPRWGTSVLQTPLMPTLLPIRGKNPACVHVHSWYQHLLCLQTANCKRVSRTVLLHWSRNGRRLALVARDQTTVERFASFTNATTECVRTVGSCNVISVCEKITAQGIWKNKNLKKCRHKMHFVEVHDVRPMNFSVFFVTIERISVFHSIFRNIPQKRTEAGPQTQK